MEKSSLTVQVVIAIILNKQGQVLVAKRPEHVHQGGLLEFPGGKVESGESLEAALKRECFEELGINVDHCEFLMDVHHDYKDKSVLLSVFSVTSYTGEPFGREGQPVMWRAIPGIKEAEIPEANRAILRQLVAK